MIKGPQGIGKSHSIVNVYRKLVCSTNYLVTFIPYCKEWKKSIEYLLLKIICQSLRVKVAVLGLGISITKPLSEETLIEVIGAIQSLLEKKECKWVFIFDQINSLFSYNANAQKLAENCGG